VAEAGGEKKEGGTGGEVREMGGGVPPLLYMYNLTTVYLGQASVASTVFLSRTGIAKGSRCRDGLARTKYYHLDNFFLCVVN